MTRYFPTALAPFAVLAACAGADAEEELAQIEANRAMQEEQAEPAALAPEERYARALDCTNATDAAATLFELLSADAAPEERADLEARIAANREAAGSFASEVIELGRELGKSDEEIRADNRAARQTYAAPPEGGDFGEFMRSVGRAADACDMEREAIMAD